MAQEPLFTLSDAAIVVAILSGPVVAVQVQKWLERGRDKRTRQLAIFEALMATRASRVSDRHIDALNAIPVAFHGNGTRLEKIRTAWNDYLQHLNGRENGKADMESWKGEQSAKFVSLVHEISQFLGFSFSTSEIENGVYLREDDVAPETDRQAVLAGFARIFRGEIALPIWVNNLHLTPEEIKKFLPFPLPSKK